MSDMIQLNIDGMEVSIREDQLSRSSVLTTLNGEDVDKIEAYWAQPIADYLNMDVIHSVSSGFTTDMSALGIVPGYGYSEDFVAIRDKEAARKKDVQASRASARVHRYDNEGFLTIRRKLLGEDKVNAFARKCLYTGDEMIGLARENDASILALRFRWATNKVVRCTRIDEAVRREEESEERFATRKTLEWRKMLNQASKCIHSLQTTQLTSNTVAEILYEAIVLASALKEKAGLIRQEYADLFLGMSHEIACFVTSYFAIIVNQLEINNGKDHPILASIPERDTQVSSSLQLTLNDEQPMRMPCGLVHSITHNHKGTLMNSREIRDHVLQPADVRTKDWRNYMAAFEQLKRGGDSEVMSMMSRAWSDHFGSGIIIKVLETMKDIGNFCAAGGSVLHAINGNRYSDIDLFIIDELKETNPAGSKNRAKKIVAKLLQRSGVLVTRNAVSWEIAVGPSEHQVTMKLQVIMRSYGSVSEVVHGFDVDSCCVAMTVNGDIHYTDRFAHAMKHKTNMVDLNLMSTSYEFRLRKYATRGFNVFIPYFDRRFLRSDLGTSRLSRFYTKPMKELTDHDRKVKAMKRAADNCRSVVGISTRSLRALMSKAVKYAVMRNMLDSKQVNMSSMGGRDLSKCDSLGEMLARNIVLNKRITEQFLELECVKNMRDELNLAFNKKPEVRDEIMEFVYRNKLTEVYTDRTADDKSKCGDLDKFAPVLAFDIFNLVMIENPSSQNYSFRNELLTMSQWLSDAYPQELIVSQ